MFRFPRPWDWDWTSAGPDLPADRKNLFPPARLLDFSVQLRRCRMIKSQWEIGNLRQAARMTADLVQALPSRVETRV